MRTPWHPKHGHRLPRFKIPSRKSGRMVAAWTTLQRDFIVVLDQDPDVIEFTEWAPQVSFRSAERDVTHTPDFLVRRRRTVELVDIALDQRPHDDRRWQPLALPLQADLIYRFHDASEIRSEPRFSNCKALRRARRIALVPSVADAILDAVIRRRARRIGDLATDLHAGALTLLGRGQLTTVLEQPLAAASPLWPGRPHG